MQSFIMVAMCVMIKVMVVIRGGHGISYTDVIIVMMIVMTVMLIRMTIMMNLMITWCSRCWSWWSFDDNLGVDWCEGPQLINSLINMIIIRMETIAAKETQKLSFKLKKNRYCKLINPHLYKYLTLNSRILTSCMKQLLSPLDSFNSFTSRRYPNFSIHSW